MFKRIDGKIVEKDEGFSMRTIGRGTIEYCQGRKTLLVDYEILTSPAGFVVYPGSIKHWEPPYSEEVINDELKDKIVDNIRRAFAWEGFDIEIAKY